MPRSRTAPSGPSVPLGSDAALHATGGRHIGARLTLLTFCLLWPAQMLTVAGIFTSISQAAIAESLRTTQIAWFALLYTIVGTLLTPFVAKLGDVFGKKRVMVIIAVIGVIGDIITATAPTFGLLLVGRVIAAFYAPMMALVFATIRDVFPPRYVGTASGAVGAGTGLFVTLCPLLAGVLLDAGGYHAVLWTLSGMTFLGLLLIVLFVPRTPRHSTGDHFDWLGGVLLGASVAVLVSVVGEVAVWGAFDPRTIGLFALAIVLLGVFVLVELRAQSPLLNVRLFRRRAFSTVIFSGAIGNGATYAGATMIVFLALFPHIPGVSDALGWTGVENALVGMPAGILGLVAGLVAGYLTSRVDPRRPFVIGLGLAIVGSLLQAAFHSNAPEIILTTVLLSIGTGAVLACGPAMIVRTVTPDEQGLASGMSVLLSNLFTAIAAQVMYASLATGGVVLKGTQFYLDAGFRAGYIAFAVIFAVALVIALLIPKLPEQLEARQGDEDVAPVADDRGPLATA